MLAGVVFHAGLAYSPMVPPLFPTADRGNAVVVDATLWFLHLFRMPLFFVVAGFFTAWLVERRGLAGLFRNRVRRILVPFLVFWPIVHLALTRSTLHAAATVEHPSPLLQWVAQGQRDGELPGAPLATGHLWFLYYLMWMYVLVWCLRALTSEPSGSAAPAWARVLGRLAALPGWVWLLVLPCLLTPSLASVTAPHPAPESLLPRFWAFGFFGPFFAWGYLLRRHPETESRLDRNAPVLLVGSLVAYSAWFFLVSGRSVEQATASSSWPVALLGAFVSVWMTSVCLTCGRRWFGRPSAPVRWLADASYWIYVVHLPVLFAIQYRLMDLDWGWSLKYFVSLALTYAICLVGYQALVRHGPIGWLLGGRSHGRRVASSVPPVPST